MSVHAAARALLEAQGGVATTQQLLSVMTRQQIDVQVRNGGLVRLWRGVYATAEIGPLRRLAALDLVMGRPIVACMGTAAALYGFDTERTTTLHVLDPGVRMRPVNGLMVHQRHGAPLEHVAGRLVTAPAWTAVEVARTLPRPRALATLDAALHAGACTPAQLESAVREQKGRRGIVAVRELAQFADGRAESAMESEARLVMIDYAVPMPELQYEIRGPGGERWRVDFAWPEQRVIAEYESIEWHSGPVEMIRDKKRYAYFQDIGWTTTPITVDDVRREPWHLAYRLTSLLLRSRHAS